MVLRDRILALREHQRSAFEACMAQHVPEQHMVVATVMRYVGAAFQVGDCAVDQRCSPRPACQAKRSKRSGSPAPKACATST